MKLTAGLFGRIMDIRKFFGASKNSKGKAPEQSADEKDGDNNEVSKTNKLKSPTVTRVRIQLPELIRIIQFNAWPNKEAAQA